MKMNKLIGASVLLMLFAVPLVKAQEECKDFSVILEQSIVNSSMTVLYYTDCDGKPQEHHMPVIWNSPPFRGKAKEIQIKITAGEKTEFEHKWENKNGLTVLCRFPMSGNYNCMAKEGPPS